MGVYSKVRVDEVGEMVAAHVYTCMRANEFRVVCTSRGYTTDSAGTDGNGEVHGWTGSDQGKTDSYVCEKVRETNRVFRARSVQNDIDECRRIRVSITVEDRGRFPFPPILLLGQVNLIPWYRSCCGREYLLRSP